eukprot:scaffold295_cov96-Cylindrotheca_fusiformis.AAC.5
MSTTKQDTLTRMTGLLALWSRLAPRTPFTIVGSKAKSVSFCRTGSCPDAGGVLNSQYYALFTSNNQLMHKPQGAISCLLVVQLMFDATVTIFKMKKVG